MHIMYSSNVEADLLVSCGNLDSLHKIKPCLVPLGEMADSADHGQAAPLEKTFFFKGIAQMLLS